MPEWWEQSKIVGTKDDWWRDSPPVGESTTAVLEDPDEAYQKGKEVQDIAVDLETPIIDVEHDYVPITEKPKPVVSTVAPFFDKEGIRAAPERTKWQKFKKFFVGDRPPLPPDADRIEKISRAFDIGVSAPMRAFLMFGKGMMLNAPDLMWSALKRMTPEDMWGEVQDMNLEEAMDWAGGYNPSGFQKSMGEMAEFVGRLRTAAPIAEKLGIIGKLPKSATTLTKAAEMAKLFGTAAVAEQVTKGASEIIDPTEAEYGFEGPKAVLRDMAIGAALSIAHSGAKVVWAKLTPTEQVRALKTLGLKKGASMDEINAAARNMARKYHPDKAKGFVSEFQKVIKARNLLRQGEVQDIVYRGQKVTLKPKLIAGELAPTEAITAPQPTLAPRKPIVTPTVPPKPLEAKPVAEGVEVAGKTIKELESIVDKAFRDKDLAKIQQIEKELSGIVETKQELGSEEAKLLEHISHVSLMLGRQQVVAQPPAKPTKQIADEAFLKDRWNTSKLGYRVELMMRGKWITKKGQITKQAEKWAESKWDELSPAVQNVVRKFIAEDYKRQLPEAKPAEGVEVAEKVKVTGEDLYKGELALGVHQQPFLTPEGLLTDPKLPHRVRALELIGKEEKGVIHNAIHKFMKKTGSIRLIGEKDNLSVEILEMPTDLQFDAIETAAAGRTILLDISNAKGKVIHSRAASSFEQFKKQVEDYFEAQPPAKPEAKPAKAKKAIIPGTEIEFDKVKPTFDGKDNWVSFSKDGKMVHRIKVRNAPRSVQMAKDYQAFLEAKPTEALKEKPVEKIYRSESEKFTAEAETKAKELLPIEVNANDIDFQKAVRASSGTHMIPENSAYIKQRDYLNTMMNVYNEMKPLAKSDEQKAILKAELERFKQGYIKWQNDIMGSESGIVSSFIVGPSKFPVARMNKRQDALQNKISKYFDWKDRALDSIRKKIKFQAIEDAGGPIAVQEKKIADAEKLQDMMKKANAIVRKKGLTDEQKIQQIVKDTGWSELTARKSLEPDYAGKKGFATWQLSNNLANIKRMKQRLSEMQAAAEKKGENIIKTYDGAEIVNNFDEERVQILFDEKPSPEVISELKKSGWHWSPSNKAWQRKNTDAAIRNSQKIIDKHYKDLKEKPKGEAGMLDVTPLQKAFDTFMDIVEPSKAVEIKHGKPVYATVIKGVHKADVARIEFNEEQLESMDRNLREFEEAIGKYPKDVQDDLMLARGKPTDPRGIALHNEAFKRLAKNHPELIGTHKMITRIGDFAHKYLKDVVGDDVGYVEDYYYGIYKDAKKVSRFLDYWRTTDRFTKEKKWFTYAEAKAIGELDIRNPNPVANIRSEYMGISRLDGMIWMRDELMRTGEDKFISKDPDKLADPEKIPEPVFRGLWVDATLAKMIKSLLSTNKVSRTGWNALRVTNNFVRSIKFMFSAFHHLAIGKQTVADSGVLGFLYKKTATRGISKGFEKNDPIFKTEEYKDYIAHGGGHRYSIDSEAQRTFTRAIERLSTSSQKIVRGAVAPFQIPEKYIRWLFERYIPKVKYAKYLDAINEKQQKLGRELTSPEKIDIIKEQQNFYGMMNERLFGRSGTVTTLLRFKFMAPGYAEGNFRTILKAILQWGQEGSFVAGRSRANIVNSFLVTGIAATVGTLILTGKPPEIPKKREDIRDLFKVDTGKKDNRGRKIMIDLMSYDKDYWTIFGKPLVGQAGEVPGNVLRRMGGMTATTWEVMSDMNQMAMGKAIYDWRGNRVIEVTDPFAQRVLALVIHELSKAVPISVSVFGQARRRALDRLTAGIVMLLGLRPTTSEKDRRESQIISRIFSLRDRQERLYYYLGTIKNPRKHIDKYNRIAQGVLDNPVTTEEMKRKWTKNLIIDTDRLMANKVHAYELAKVADKKDLDEIKKLSQWLKNFDITEDQHRKHLIVYEMKHRKLILEMRPTDADEMLRKEIARFYADKNIYSRKVKEGTATDAETRLARKYGKISSNISQIGTLIHKTDETAKRKRYYERIKSLVERSNP